MSTPTNIITLMIVDDHPLFRTGLQRVFEFEDDLQIVAYCDHGNRVLGMAQQIKPNVILLDVNLPGTNGLQVARQIRQTHPPIPSAIIILTAHHDEEQVIHAFRSGAAAYCRKDIESSALVDLIRQVAQGHRVVNGIPMSESELQAWLEGQIEQASGPYLVDDEGHYIPLSPRELEILRYVTQGLINKEIAAKLKISQQTVKNHMTSILKKMNVTDRTQAAVVALRRGWVRMDSKPQSHET